MDELLIAADPAPAPGATDSVSSDSSEASWVDMTFEQRVLQRMARRRAGASAPLADLSQPAAAHPVPATDSQHCSDSDSVSACSSCFMDLLSDEDDEGAGRADTVESMPAVRDPSAAAAHSLRCVLCCEPIHFQPDEPATEAAWWACERCCAPSHVLCMKEWGLRQRTHDGTLDLSVPHTRSDQSPKAVTCFRCGGMVLWSHVLSEQRCVHGAPPHTTKVLQ